MEKLTVAEKRRQYFAKAKQSANAVASRTARELERRNKAQRAEARAVYATSVSELTRGASKIGVTHNTPVKVNVGSFAHGSAPQTMVFHGRQGI